MASRILTIIGVVAVAAITPVWLPAGAQTSTPGRLQPADYQSRRGELLRQITELKAKIQSLEVELQLLEEERSSSSSQPAAPRVDAWRTVDSSGSSGSPGEDRVKKPAAPRCPAITRDGKRCIRSVETGRKYCWQHQNMK